MVDVRVALKENYELYDETNRKIVIKNEVGRGGNCIVYNAFYFDAIGTLHNVRIKELYPIYIMLNRLEDSSLECIATENEKFDIAKDDFIQAYKTNIAIRNIVGLTNSTMDMSDIIRFNNTIYIIMAMDEGIDYRKYEDKNLKEIFEHIRSLACVIGKYHDNGYLHLDIKPENVFVIPETTEHIYLFDFDSVVRSDEIKRQGFFKLSFSDGFSAPEQVQGKSSKIDKHTDIYSIGALLFYKIFGRKPTIEDTRISSKYYFEKSKYYNKKYSPKLKRLLNNFFYKTLSISTISRWKDTEKVINALNELIEISDLEKNYIVDSFQYNSAFFVGRDNYLVKIKEILDENQVVFLSGIGGIGKTELAKKFVNKYRDMYDTVVFAVYENSLEYMVKKEIIINAMNIEENEDDTSYFERALQVLKTTTTDRDLIIVDNFDVETDDRLEDLLQCPCKFIFTTRKDFRDFNYKQINVDRIESSEELFELFSNYNDNMYDIDEKKAIEKLIEFIDGHTMTVELIAKYLRNTNIMPSELYTDFKNRKEGITSTEDIDVKQRKDRRLNIESVNNHLSILFDVFSFDAIECEIISSLSLFDRIRINKNLFYEICKIDKVEEKLDSLIKNGWVEYNDNNNKVSLHQVIQDLIYMKLKPNDISCKNIVEGMLRYMQKKPTSYTERKIRNNVLDVFLNRIEGSGLDYAKLCVKHGRVNKINEAESICRKFKTIEAYDILEKIYLKRISREVVCKDIFNTELSSDDYCLQQICKISDLLEETIECCKNASVNNNDLIRRYITIADRVDSMLSNSSLEIYEAGINGLNKIYDKIENLYELSSQMLSLSDISLKEKVELYSKIRRFYSDEDMYMSLYRYEKYSDLEKAYYYQTIIDEIEKKIEENSKQKNKVIKLRVNDISCISLAEKYLNEGEYEKAIGYYMKAYKEEDEPYEITMQQISRVFIKMGNYKSAIKCLEKVLDKDKKNENDPEAYFSYSAYICLELIDILVKQNHFEKAKKYAYELIYYKEKDIYDEDHNEYSIMYVIAAYYHLYLLENDITEKEKFWKKCVELYKTLPKKTNIESEINDFIFEYLDKQGDDNEVLKVIEGMGFQIDINFQKKILLNRIEKNKKMKNSLKNTIIMLLKLSDIICDDYKENSNVDEAFDYCKEAQQFYTKNALNDDYIQSLIYKSTIKVLSKDPEQYKKIDDIREKCNFYLLAEVHSEKCDIKEKVEVWSSAFEEYRYLDDYKNALLCLNQMYKLINENMDKFDFIYESYSLFKVLKEQISMQIKLKEYDLALKTNSELYSRTIEYIVSENDVNKILDYIRMLNIIADFYIEMGQTYTAIKGYILIIYIVVAKSLNEERLQYKDINEIEIDNLSKEIIRQIDLKENETNVDLIVDTKEKIIEQREQIEEIKNIIEPLILKIEDKFQNKEIEFKSYS